jgi:hypothetical protein
MKKGKINLTKLYVGFSLGLLAFSNFSFTKNKVYASTTPKLSVSDVDSVKGSAKLNWSPAIGSTDEPWNYQLEEKKDGSDVPQTIPSKETVKVLNVYPNVDTKISYTINGQVYNLPGSAALKNWMEGKNSESSNGYGKGQIHVDELDIQDFNTDTDKYLKNSAGEYKYDVIMFGTWDDNGKKDLSKESAEATREFIKSGRGVLAGHDTVANESYKQNFWSLHDAFHLISEGAYDNWDGIAAGGQGGSTTPADIKKKGLLTNYPWKIGEPGTTLTIQQSHTLGQKIITDDNGTNDVWMAYHLKPLANSFYLETFKNTAMIQTGHYAGLATSDEQKVLANTLFYLSQLTQNTSFEDHTGQDVAAPDKPKFGHATRNGQNISLQNLSSKDNGSNYDYTVIATGQNSGQKMRSNTVSIRQTSGMNGYVYKVDANASATLKSTDNKLIDATKITIPKTDCYIHVAAVDKANNVSDTLNIPVDQTPPKIDIQTNNKGWTNQSIPYTVNFTDSGKLDSGLHSTTDLNNKTANNSASKSFQVTNQISENGSFTATAIDDFGNESKTEINVKNIDMVKPSTQTTDIENSQGNKFSDEDETHEAKIKHIVLKTSGQAPLNKSTLKTPEGSYNIKWSTDNKQVEFDWNVPTNGAFTTSVQNEAGSIVTNNFDIKGLLDSPYVETASKIEKNSSLNGKTTDIEVDNNVEFGDPRHFKSTTVVPVFKFGNQNTNPKMQAIPLKDDLLSEGNSTKVNGGIMIKVPASMYQGKYIGQISYELKYK